MEVELKRILIPFLTAFLQVFTSALALGLLPALGVFARRRQYGLLWRWGIFTFVCIVAAVYALPLAHRAWKAYTPLGFKPVAMWMGYFVSILFAPMLLPEPLRIARRRVREERPREHRRREYRLPK